jgi:hypothetical protein
VYAELKRLAKAYLRREHANHSLAATALVHEAYLKLVDQRRVHWRNRSHFFGIAAQAMRRVAPDGRMMTVAVPEEGEPGQPKALFRTPLRPVSYLDQYAATPDGQRFLIIAPSQTDESARLMVISNWPALLGK